MMPHGSRVTADPSDRITGLLQTFTHSSLRGFSSIRYYASRGFRCVGNSFARLMSDFLGRIFSLFYGSLLVLILCYHQTKRKQDRDG